MLKIKTNQIIFDLKNNAFKSDGENLTIGEAFTNLLSTQDSSNPHRSLVLARKFSSSKEEIELKAEDIVFIKDIVKKSRLYYPIIIGQLLEIIDPEESSE